MCSPRIHLLFAKQPSSSSAFNSEKDRNPCLCCGCGRQWAGLCLLPYKVLGLNLEWDGIRREATLRTRERKEAAIGTPMMGHIRTGRMRRKCLDRAQMRAAGHRCPQWRRPAEESLVKRRPRHQGWKDLCPRSGQDKCHVAVSLCALMPLWSHHFNVANCPHPRSGSVSLMSPCYCLWGSIDLLSKIYTSEIMYMLF